MSRLIVLKQAVFVRQGTFGNDWTVVSVGRQTLLRAVRGRPGALLNISGAQNDCSQDDSSTSKVSALEGRRLASTSDSHTSVRGCNTGRHPDLSDLRMRLHTSPLCDLAHITSISKP